MRATLGNRTSLLSYVQAQQILESHAHSYGKEQVELDDSLGRILAEPIFSDRDYPPFNRSAMDGIAINYSDFEAGIREYGIAEVICAGQRSSKKLHSGECYKIMTGAAVPTSANAVIRNEDICFKDNTAIIQLDTCKLNQNIAGRGQDIKRGAFILEHFTCITPAIVSLLASLGMHRVWVEKLPSVSLFSTGNEIVPVDGLVSDIQIRNSNQHLLKALLRQQGIKPVCCEHVPDNKELLKEAFFKGLSSDMLIVSGGVSAGDEDFVPAILEDMGVKKLFHKVAIKPGKPIWCGKIPSGPLVFALPGNPFACLVTFKLFVETVLKSSFGAAERKLPLKNGRIKKGSFDEFFPVRLTGNPPVLEQMEINGSGDIRLGLGADGIGLHPGAEMEIVAGLEIPYYKL